ncbi:hypothetical protein KKF11_00425 [Patescibacteria group bacterium]|nr:hypothetical protein [Patescibacteria group bacterium]
MKKVIFLIFCFLFLFLKPSPASASNEVILERPLGITILENRNLLVADGGGKDWTTNGAKVIELTRNGEIVWIYDEGLTFPHKAIKLQNRNILIVDTTNDRLLEVNKEKEIVWTTDSLFLSDNTKLKKPKDVLEVEENIFLVADTNNGRIIKINKKGQILWQRFGLKNPTSIDFKDGNILIVEFEARRVFEIDKFGKEIWSLNKENITGDFQPITASFLENGSYMISDRGENRILEVNKEKEIVFKLDENLNSPFSALKRNEGIIISDSAHSRIIEINAQNDTSWVFRNMGDVKPINFSNGDFEKDEDQNNIADDWIAGNLLSEGRGSFSISNLANKGDQSAKISYDGLGYLFLYQRVKIKPERDYDLVGVIKSNDFNGISRFEVIFLDNMGGQMGEAIVTPIHFGTTDWTRYETIFTTPQGAAVIDIRCMVDGIGEVWFDNLTFKQVGWQKEVGLKLSGIIILAGIILVFTANKLIKE